MSIDTARTVSTVGGNGNPVAMQISAIVGEAVAQAGLDGVVAGTTTASRGVVVDGNKQLDALNVTTLGVGAARLAMSGSVRAGRATVTSGQATAHTLAITSGAATIVAQFVQILRSGGDVTADAAVSVSGGTITVADGAATYDVTEGDVINWIAVGA